MYLCFGQTCLYLRKRHINHIAILPGGLQLFFMGIFGQYLAKAYTEIKNRPIYIVAESNLEKER